MNDNTDVRIKNFMNEVKSCYPNIEMKVRDDYDVSTVIFHNYENWLDDNDDFGNVTYELFKKYFRKDGFIDVGFSFSSNIVMQPSIDSSSCQKTNVVAEPLSLLGDMRGFDEEEKVAYNEMMEGIFENTGVNVLSSYE